MSAEYAQWSQYNKLEKDVNELISTAVDYSCYQPCMGKLIPVNRDKIFQESKSKGFNTSWCIAIFKLEYVDDLFLVIEKDRA